MKHHILIIRLSLAFNILLLSHLAVLAQQNPDAQAKENIQDLKRSQEMVIGDYEIYRDEIWHTYSVQLVKSAKLKQDVLAVMDNGKTCGTLNLVDSTRFICSFYNIYSKARLEFTPNADRTGYILRLTENGNVFEAERKKTSSERMTFTKKELQEDFEQLKSAIEKYHPAKYQFIDKKSFDELFDQQYSRIKGEMSLEEFYDIASLLVARIGCGHTELNMPKGFWQRQNVKYFPLKLHYDDGQAYVIDYFKSEQPIPKGSRIVSINGKPIADIAETIMNDISADGCNKTTKLWNMNLIFPLFYSMIIGSPDSFNVEYLDKEQAKSVLLTPIAYNDLPSFAPKEPYLDFKIIDGKNTAVMTIKTFAYYGRLHPQFNSFIDSSFAKVSENKVENLILDLRGNAGGDPICSVHLLSYIEAEPVVYFGKIYPDFEQFAKPIPRAENAFAGKLYVLIDAGGFSTTGHLTSLIKEHGMGTFIGEETGGTWTCNDASKNIELRNTRCRLRVPSITFFTAVTDMPRDHGVIPEYPVKPTIQDLIDGRDAVMEYALNLIEGNKKE